MKFSLIHTIKFAHNVCFIALSLTLNKNRTIKKRFLKFVFCKQCEFKALIRSIPKTEFWPSTGDSKMKKGKKEKETSNQIIQHVWIDMPTGSKFISDLIFLVLFGVIGHTFDVGADFGWCYGLYINNHPRHSLYIRTESF